MPPSKARLAERVQAAENAVIEQVFARMFSLIAEEPAERHDLIVNAVTDAINAAAPTDQVAGIRARLRLETVPGAIAYIIDAVRVVAPELANKVMA